MRVSDWGWGLGGPVGLLIWVVLFCHADLHTDVPLMWRGLALWMAHTSYGALGYAVGLTVFCYFAAYLPGFVLYRVLKLFRSASNPRGQ